MFKRMSIVILIGYVVGVTVPIVGQEKSNKTKEKISQVIGEVVDLGCFVGRNARGAEHQQCAARCLNGGNPAGLVADDGTVYTIAASAPKYSEFAAQKIRLSGVIKNMMIRPEKMAIQKNGKWHDIEMSMGAPKQSVSKK